jgi:hypothetical protein
VAKDQRIVYGARCMWWGPIQEVDKLPSGLPCCPHCKGVLFEVPNEREWWATVDAHESIGNVGYRGFVEWLRDHHFFNIEEARQAYEEAK